MYSACEGNGISDQRFLKRGFESTSQHMIEINEAPKVLTLSFLGDLDLRCKEELGQSVDSTILGCLAALRNRMLENGGLGIVRIVQPPSPLLKKLSLCDLNAVFEISAAPTRVSVDACFGQPT